MRSFLFSYHPCDLKICHPDTVAFASKRWFWFDQEPSAGAVPIHKCQVRFLTNDVNSCVWVDTCISICIYTYIYMQLLLHIFECVYMCIYIYGMAKSRSVYDLKGNWRVSSSLWNILWANSVFSAIHFETDKIALFGRQQCQQNSLKVPCQDLRQRAPCTETA